MTFNARVLEISEYNENRRSLSLLGKNEVKLNISERGREEKKERGRKRESYHDLVLVC